MKSKEMIFVYTPGFYLVKMKESLNLRLYDDRKTKKKLSKRRCLIDIQGTLIYCYIGFVDLLKTEFDLLCPSAQWIGAWPMSLGLDVAHYLEHVLWPTLIVYFAGQLHI